MKKTVHEIQKSTVNQNQPIKPSSHQSKSKSKSKCGKTVHQNHKTVHEKYKRRCRDFKNAPSIKVKVKVKIKVNVKPI